MSSSPRAVRFRCQDCCAFFSPRGSFQYGSKGQPSSMCAQRLPSAVAVLLFMEFESLLRCHRP